MKNLVLMLCSLFALPAFADLYTGPFQFDTGSTTSVHSLYNTTIANLTITGSWPSTNVATLGAGGEYYGTGRFALRTAANGNTYFLQGVDNYLEFDLGTSSYTNVLLQYGCTNPNCVYTMPNSAADTFVLANTTQTLTNKTVAYTPGSPSNWAGTAPANVQQALDRMAALLYTLNSNTPIP